MRLGCGMLALGALTQIQYVVVCESNDDCTGGIAKVDDRFDD